MSLEPQEPFDALVVVSPAACGDEEKNQDRARWLAALQVACVCDGVTSSPRSAAAADLVTTLSPALFTGDAKDRLGIICDLLVAQRLEAQRDPVVLPGSIPEAMHEMLAQAVRERMENAFQTTLVAASFAATDQGTTVELIRCGDSAFFAFSSRGELLTSSPSWCQASPTPADAAHPATEGIRFGPGDELHIKILGRASEPSFAVDASQIPPHHRSRWFVCTPLDLSRECDHPGQQGHELPVFRLSSHDRLLIPAFLLGRGRGKPCDCYREVLYSSSIRLVSNRPSAAPSISFAGKGSVTEVLPDHFAAGRWIHRQEHLPTDAHFVLASDGFYSAFEDPHELWAWLAKNRADLHDHQKQPDLMRQLHERLNTKSGDDDISLVWVSPGAPIRRRSTGLLSQATVQETSPCPTKS